MRREERVTVQGPVEKQQPEGMSHRGGGGGSGSQRKKGARGPLHVPVRSCVRARLCSPEACPLCLSPLSSKALEQQQQRQEQDREEDLRIMKEELWEQEMHRKERQLQVKEEQLRRKEHRLAHQQDLPPKPRTPEEECNALIDDRRRKRKAEAEKRAQVPALVHVVQPETLTLGGRGGVGAL